MARLYFEKKSCTKNMRRVVLVNMIKNESCIRQKTRVETFVNMENDSSTNATIHTHDDDGEPEVTSS